MHTTFWLALCSQFSTEDKEGSRKRRLSSVLLTVFSVICYRSTSVGQRCVGNVAVVTSDYTCFDGATFLMQWIDMF